MFQEQPFLKKQLYIVSYVIGGLLFQHGIRAGDPYAGVDIEELLNAIVALSDRSRSEDDVTPFIQQWHPMVDSLSAGFPTGLGLPDLYSNVATIMQQMLVPLTWLTDAADVKYLSPLLRLLQRQNRWLLGR